jgi:hypothetical protein
MLNLWCHLAADQCNCGQFTLTTLELTRYVRMDAAAIRAQILHPPPESGSANLHLLVLGHMDHRRASQGHE